MPRNASGTYSLPEPPFVTQTTISSTVMNSQLSDIASALTTSIASTGVTPLTGGLKGIVGATVAYGFDGDTTTGWGSDTAGQGYFKSAGTEIVRITSTGVSITGTLSFSGSFSGTVSTSGATASFTAFEGISTEAGAGSGPYLDLYRNSTTPAVSDALGAVRFFGQDSASNKQSYAIIVPTIVDPTSGSEDSSLFFAIMVAGASSDKLVLTAAGADVVGTTTSTTGFKVGSNPTATPGKGPTYQVFTAGTGATYTTPAGVTWIRVRAVGGGGGGTSGSAGTSTSFNAIVANPGLPGSGGTGGAGGSGGVGTANLRINGSNGGPGASVSGADVSAGTGGSGGDAPLFAGGGTAGSGGGNGGAAIANSGGGGGGNGGTGAGASGNGGGGSGEYFELVITSPSASYIYTVGPGGAAGSGPGAGAAGRIIVEEFYN